MSGLVALTGGTGFIGHAVLTSLVSRGWRVRAITRRSTTAVPSSGNVEWVGGDLHDRTALLKLVHEADAVVHCAGAVRGGCKQDFTRVNVDGTINLAAAAQSQNKPPRFLFISSLAARAPELSWYACSKRDAEIALSEHAGSMPWTALRPTAVYGPGDREVRPLLAAMHRGLLILPAGPNNRFGLLHVQDLADAIAAWLRRPQADYGTFELDDGTPGGYDARALAEIADAVWRRQVLTVRVPAAVLSMFAHVNLRLSRLFRYAPMLTPGKVHEILHPDWTCNNEPLCRALAWAPRIRLADALLDKALFPA